MPLDPRLARERGYNPLIWYDTRYSGRPTTGSLYWIRVCIRNEIARPVTIFFKTISRSIYRSVVSECFTASSSKWLAIVGSSESLREYSILDILRFESGGGGTEVALE